MASAFFPTSTIFFDVHLLCGDGGDVVDVVVVVVVTSVVDVVVPCTAAR